MAGEEDEPLAVELPASFIEVASAAGIDPLLLAEMMLACITEYTARKLAYFLRRGRDELEAEANGWRRDVAEVSDEADES